MPIFEISLLNSETSGLLISANSPGSHNVLLATLFAVILQTWAVNTTTAGIRFKFYAELVNCEITLSKN